MKRPLSCHQAHPEALRVLENGLLQAGHQLIRLRHIFVSMLVATLTP